MKAEDLMIGDWVKSLKEDHLGEYGQVIDIDHHDTVLLEYQCVNYYTDVEHIEPIPITKEILEKNGFNIEIAPYTPDWMRCILNPNFFLEDRLKGFYHFNGNHLAKIQYIHELQHALKLCGIEKTIEL